MESGFTWEVIDRENVRVLDMKIILDIYVDFCEGVSFSERDGVSGL